MLRIVAEQADINARAILVLRHVCLGLLPRLKTVFSGFLLYAIPWVQVLSSRITHFTKRN